MVKHVAKNIFIGGLLLVSQLAFGTTIDVSVDRNPVQVNESFQIIFQSNGSVDDDPDFAPLEQDFEIISQSQSSNVQIINGSFNRQSRWHVTAMAKRVGNITIPVIHFGNDQTKPVHLQVIKQTSATGNSNLSDLFIDVKVDRTTAYVQSQLLYTIRFYSAVNINGASMSEPKISGAEVLVQKLGEDASFETHQQGRRYRVVERKYALFPQKSGKLTISPIDMAVQVIQNFRSNLDPFGRNTITKRINSESIDIDIKPIPAGLPAKNWLPASQVELVESWSEEKTFIVGEPITRTLTLKALGLTGAQLPPLMTDTVDGFKIYPDKPQLDQQLTTNGILGSREEKIALIPAKAGELTLPALEIHWWNINSNQMEVATLPARTIHIQAGSDSKVDIGASSSQPQSVGESSSALVAQTTTQSESPWFAIAMALALGWLLTIIAWVLTTKQNGQEKSNPTEKSGGSLKKFHLACQQNNPTLARTELLAWGKLYWRDDPPMGIDDIAERLGDEVKQQIQLLNRQLYGSEHECNWLGNALWFAVEKAEKRLKMETKPTPTALAQLYPS